MKAAFVALLAVTALVAVQGASGVQCPDGSSCESGQTCCVLASGSYGCCSFENAVCCSDHLHCCPQGYQCDVAAGLCMSGRSFRHLSLKRPAKRVE